MFELRLTAADFARIRFAVSPLWEVSNAVRSLANPRQRAYHLPWLEQVRPRLADLDIEPLLALMPARGYNVDLISPIPEQPRTTVHEQLAQVRATPLAHVRRELDRTLRDRGGEAPPPELVELARHPKSARARIADALEACWEVMMAPYWPRINDLLAADIAHHSRLLADHGLERLLPSISPAMSWRGRTLRIESAGYPLARHTTRGRGLLLQPSAFGWPIVALIIDEPYQPAIAYPARGVAELWQPAVAATNAPLAALLGRTRATLLASVREPATTTVLARRHELAAATVSQHLSVLAAAGLVRSGRNGREVRYATTALGDALLRDGGVSPAESS